MSDRAVDYSEVARRPPTPRWRRIAYAVVAFVLAVAMLLYLFLPRSSNEPVVARPANQWGSMGSPPPNTMARDRESDTPPAGKKAADDKPFVGPPETPGRTPMGHWEATQSVLGGTTGGVTQVAGDAQGGDEKGQDTPYSRSMQATVVPNTKPKPMRFDRRWTIKKGTTFGCTPPMPIDTQLPGPLWCDVDEDVWSMDLNNILLPKHTQVNMQIERGLGLGNDRAVIVMTDALTPLPDQVPIPLEGLAADDLGQNGVPGDIRAHEWEKIKHALLFSAVEGLTGAAQASLQQQQSVNQYFGGASSGIGSLASIAYQHDINIPTTLYRGPGQPIKIYVARYVDLSNFYQHAFVRSRN